MTANSGKGFTLVELVTVIILLGIISAISLPRFFNNDNFTSFFDRSEFESALSWTRNRAITSHCAHEFRITSTGWMVLRDDDRDGDSTDADCNSTSSPGQSCLLANEEFFSFIYRNDADIVSDGSTNQLSGSNITSTTTHRLIFSPTGRLYRLAALPGDLTTGCTATQSSDLITNGTTLTLDQITLTADGGTAYVAIQ